MTWARAFALSSCKLTSTNDSFAMVVLLLPCLKGF